MHPLGIVGNDQYFCEFYTNNYLFFLRKYYLIFLDFFTKSKASFNSWLQRGCFCIYFTFISIFVYELHFAKLRIKNRLSRPAKSIKRNKKQASDPLTQGALACMIFGSYLKNPLTISSSASFSVRPRVMSLISCSPAIFPIAAS